MPPTPRAPSTAAERDRGLSPKGPSRPGALFQRFERGGESQANGLGMLRVVDFAGELDVVGHVVGADVLGIEIGIGVLDYHFGDVPVSSVVFDGDVDGYVGGEEYLGWKSLAS